MVVVLAGGLGGWASTAEISGALIAPGQIVVETNVKKVQHPTGGVVGELLARDGDEVKAGEIVVRLDDTVTKANLAIVTKNLDAALARAARLQAEQRGLDRITFPPQLTDRARRSRRRHRDGERKQAVRGARQRPRRPEGAIARARHPAQRGDRRPRRRRRRPRTRKSRWCRRSSTAFATSTTSA